MRSRLIDHLTRFTRVAARFAKADPIVRLIGPNCFYFHNIPTMHEFLKSTVIRGDLLERTRLVRFGAFLSAIARKFAKGHWGLLKNLGNPNSGLKYQAKDGPFKVFKTPISDRSMSLGKIESAERINKTMIAYANTLSVEFV